MDWGLPKGRGVGTYLDSTALQYGWVKEFFTEKEKLSRVLKDAEEFARPKR